MAKTPKVAHKYGRKVCIFCSATPTTEEHVWPRWAAKLLPQSNGHMRYILDGNKKAGPFKLRKRLNRQGSVFTIRIKRVCKDCNNGWMGNFEEAIKPLLTQLILGESLILDADRIALLTTYLAYKLMVLDWTDGKPVLPPSANHAFHLKREMPPLSYIYVANCFEGDWRNTLRTYLCAVSLPEDAVVADQPGNLKSIAFGIGNLFVFAVFSTQVDMNLNFDNRKLIRIWPPTQRELQWPPMYPITSSNAENIARTIERFIRTSDTVTDAGK